MLLSEEKIKFYFVGSSIVPIENANIGVHFILYVWYLYHGSIKRSLSALPSMEFSRHSWENTLM